MHTVYILFCSQVGELHKGRENLPVFSWRKNVISPLEILEELLKPRNNGTTCSAVPRNISHNVCFMVDVDSLKSSNDWKSDDMGVWKNNGVQYFRMGMENDAVFQIDEDDVLEDGINHYIIKRTYYKNKSSPDLRKIVSILQGKIIARFIYN